jgi:hypothetical protein
MQKDMKKNEIQFYLFQCRNKENTIHMRISYYVERYLVSTYSKSGAKK